jgi:hypothetical protein
MTFTPRAITPFFLVIIVSVIGLDSPCWVRAQNSKDKTPPATQGATQRNQSREGPDEATRRLIQQVDLSGQIIVIGEKPSERLAPAPEIAPGVAPLLGFRSFDREARYRLGRLGLVVDDAGH